MRRSEQALRSASPESLVALFLVTYLLLLGCAAVLDAQVQAEEKISRDQLHSKPVACPLFGFMSVFCEQPGNYVQRSLLDLPEPPIGLGDGVCPPPQPPVALAQKYGGISDDTSGGHFRSGAEAALIRLIPAMGSQVDILRSANGVGISTPLIRLYSGRPIMFHFYTISCVPCRLEFPLIRSLLEGSGGASSPVDVVMVSNDPAHIYDDDAVVAHLRGVLGESTLSKVAVVRDGKCRVNKLLSGTECSFPKSVIFSRSLDLVANKRGPQEVLWFKSILTQAGQSVR